MNKLKSYFDYFDKYYEVESWDWYNGLNKYVEIAQKIIEEISKTNFSVLDDNAKQTKIEQILKECSNEEIKSIDDFFERYLFEQSNGIGGIGRGLFWGTTKKEIKSKINHELFISLLQECDIFKADEIITGLMNVDRLNWVAKTRFLRTLFPYNITSLDKEDDFNNLIEKIQEKLSITIDGKILEKHCKLMEYVKSVDYAKKQIFFRELYDMIENNLNLKKAIVYYGAPGTGKTFKAKKIARQFIDEHRIKIGKPVYKKESNYHIKTVQFHPSYSYEDFMEGIRPTIDRKLLLFNGTFKEFCKKEGCKEIELYSDSDFLERFKEKEYDFSQIKISELLTHQKKILEISNELAEGITIQEIIEPAFFIIDEINRAELSRVFGELMYSLEYRGYNGKIKTQYAYLNKDEKEDSVFFWEKDENWFFIPQNVFIIGTMNNIDRSVDSFDFALRRRFMWEEIIPDFNVVRDLFSVSWKDELAKAFENLNREIEKDDILGKDYRIGHAYALVIKPKPIQNRFKTDTEAKEFLWNDFIKPLLEEYLRGLGNEQKATEKLDSFKKSFGIE